MKPWLSLTGLTFLNPVRKLSLVFKLCVICQLHISGALVTSHLHPNQHLSPGDLGWCPHLWFCGLFECSMCIFLESVQSFP